MEPHLPSERLVEAIKNAIELMNFLSLEVAGLDIDDLPLWFSASLAGLEDEVSVIRKLLSTIGTWEPLGVIAVIDRKLVVLLAPTDDLLAQKHFDEREFAAQVERLERVAGALADERLGKAQRPVEDIPVPVRKKLEKVAPRLAELTARNKRNNDRSAEVLFPHTRGGARPLRLPLPEQLRPKSPDDEDKVDLTGTLRFVFPKLGEAILDDGTRLTGIGRYWSAGLEAGSQITCTAERTPMVKKYLRICSPITVSQPELAGVSVRAANDADGSGESDPSDATDN